MKRFLVFAGDDAHPRGGWFDFVDSFDVLEDAETLASKAIYWWSHVVDTTTGEVTEIQFLC